LLLLLLLLLLFLLLTALLVEREALIAQALDDRLSDIMNDPGSFTKRTHNS